ncbi:MAG: aldehyde dehydrogenase [Cyclobacteriaceae bacterium]
MSPKELVQKQKEFFNSNKTKTVNFRIKQLKKLKSVVKAHEQDFYDAIYADFRKSEFDTYTTEISFIYRDIDEAIKNLPKWSRNKRVGTNLVNLPGKSYLMPEPMGATLIIGAWNYPFQLSIQPVIASMAAGNTVVLKPSEIPEACSAIMAKVINENFSTEYLSVVEGGVSQTTALLKEQWDKIFFTGSTAVGRIVYQAAAKNLTPVTLELGGKSPVIVDKNCDLKNSAKRIVWAKFLNSGQTCIAPDYILAHEDVEEKLLEHLKDFIEKFDYSPDNKNYTNIINGQNYDRLVSLIDEEKVYVGGYRNPETNSLGPTVLRGISYEDKIMEDEIFGPILPVLSYNNLDNAISKIKEKPKPLAAYIFTNNREVKKKILKEVSFGGGEVNDALMHITNSHLPFGGVGPSGIGNYHGYFGFQTFSHFKSIIEKPFWGEPNFKYPPYTSGKLAWIKRLIG